MFRGFAKKILSLSRIATTVAVLAFGFQSVALPVHATVHAIHHAVTALPTTSAVVDADCDLCDLAMHQAVQAPLILPFETVEPVSVRAESALVETVLPRFALLPPVRGPPVRA